MLGQLHETFLEKHKLEDEYKYIFMSLNIPVLSRLGSHASLPYLLLITWTQCVKSDQMCIIITDALQCLLIM